MAAASSRVLAAQRYGAPEVGRCIENKASIMQELDATLGTKPDQCFVEYLLCESTIPPTVGQDFVANFARFGHSAMRYRFRGGKEDMVMNIVGRKDAPAMVNFIKAENYLYGLPTSESEQGGVYNRQFYAIRIHETPLTKISEEKIEALHAYYHAMALSQKVQAKRFDLMKSPLMNVLPDIPFMEDFVNDPLEHGAIRGNCALWTSEGLVAAGIAGIKRQFPKAILIDLYERYMRVDPSAVKIVEYREVGKEIIPFVHRCNGDGWKSYTSIVHPILPLRTVRYWNVRKMCDAMVVVEEAKSGAIAAANPDSGPPPPLKAVIATNISPKRPSVHFLIRNASFVAVAVLGLYGLWTGQRVLPAAIFSPPLILLVWWIKSRLLM